MAEVAVFDTRFVATPVFPIISLASVLVRQDHSDVTLSHGIGILLMFKIWVLRRKILWFRREVEWKGKRGTRVFQG